MVSPIDKKLDSSVPSNVPPTQSHLTDSAAKAEAATDKVLGKESSKETKIHKAGPVPPAQISTRINIPPNFKSLPLVLQLQIIENLEKKELVALKDSLGKKGNPELVNRINARLVFPILANFLNKEEVTQKGGIFPLDRLSKDYIQEISEYLPLKTLGNVSATSKRFNELGKRLSGNKRYVENLKKNEMNSILKKHPEWKSVVQNWDVSHIDKMWLLHLYELNQYVSVLYVSSTPLPDAAELLKFRGEITDDLNKKYEELKKILKR